MNIVPFSLERAPHFDRINRAWIAKDFTVESFDDQVLKDPQSMIINKGGEVWFAEINGSIVGTCALLPLEDGSVELTKLGVDETARGCGVAKALMHHCHERARCLGAPKITLLTSRKLKPANTLYVSLGYQEIAIPPELAERYARCDVIYELRL